MPTYTLDYDNGTPGNAGGNYGGVVGCRVGNDDGTTTYVPAGADQWAALVAGPLAAVSLDPVPVPLAAAQAQKYAAIDARTDQLVAAGFAYAGHPYGLDQQSQLNYTQIMVGVSAGLIALPYPVAALDGYVLSVPDQPTLAAFLGTYAARQAQIRGGGGSGGAADLYQQVAGAATVAAVRAVQDTRA